MLCAVFLIYDNGKIYAIGIEIEKYFDDISNSLAFLRIIIYNTSIIWTIITQGK